MNWEKKKYELTSDEIIILSVLSMNVDKFPNKLWIDYNSLFKISNIEGNNFKDSLESLISKNLIRLGNQGNGLSVALEERYEDFINSKKSEVIEDLKGELKMAKDLKDEDLVKEIEKLIRVKTNEFKDGK